MRIPRRVDRRSRDIIIVNQSFATLVEIDERGGVTYDIEYTINQVRAIRADVSSIQITVRNKPRMRPKSSLLDDADQHVIVPKSIADALVHAPSKTKEVKSANAKTIIATKSVGFASKLSKQAILTIKNVDDDEHVDKLLPMQKLVVTKKVSEITSKAISFPVMKSAIHVNNVDAAIPNVQTAALALVLTKAIDPANVIGSTTIVKKTIDSYAGTVTQKTQGGLKNVSSKIYSGLSNILNASKQPDTIESIIADVEVPFIETSQQRFVKSVQQVTIPALESTSISTIYIEFKLLDVNDKVIDRFDHKIDHKQHVDHFITPRHAPIVKCSPSQLPGRNVIDVTQVDRNAIAVRMYRRVISRTTNINDAHESAYVDAGEFNIKTSTGMMKIVDRINNSSTIMYRFVAVNKNGILGTNFASIVVPGVRVLKMQRRRTLLLASLDIVPQGNNAFINVTNVSPGPVAIALQRRNVTIHEQDFSYMSSNTINRGIALLDDIDAISFIDDNVKTGNIYEYRLIFFLECGSSVISNVSMLYEHPSVENSGVDIIISTPNITKMHDSIRRPQRNNRSNNMLTYDVQFSMNSVIDETDVDQIKKTLERQGMSSLFVNEMNDARENLSALIVHGVKRFNTMTGELEDFGVISDKIFSDALHGKSSAVKSIRSGTTYRYIVSSMLRMPESLFDEYRKIKRSPSRNAATVATAGSLSSQEYAFSPAKYYHPHVLKTGTLSTPKTRKQHHAKSEFAYGDIGNAHVVEITVPTSPLQITNIVPTRFDTRTALISWNVSGDTDNVDYYMITMTHMNTEQHIGNIHALGNMSMYKYYHDLTTVDVGTVYYTVTAMLTNFNTGASHNSQEFVV